MRTKTKNLNHPVQEAIFIDGKQMTPFFPARNSHIDGYITVAEYQFAKITTRRNFMGQDAVALLYMCVEGSDSKKVTFFFFPPKKIDL